MGSRRFYEIDLLRFIAALSVVMFHYAFRGHAADNLTVFSYIPVVPVAKYGYLGVDLFFIISGFVILMTASNNSTVYFIVSRIVRLYPAFWICCSVTALVCWAVGDPNYSVSVKQYVINMTMLSGFVGVRPIDEVYWSLFVEMRFYLLVVFMLMLGEMRRIKYWLGIWLFLSIFLSVYDVRYLGYILIPEYAPYFVAGALFYLIQRDGVTAYKLSLVVASYIAAGIASGKRVIGMEAHYNVAYDSVVVWIVMAILFLLFFAIATHKTKIIASPMYVIFGMVTYPLYLIHENTGFIIFNHLNGYINRHLLMWGTVSCMIAFSWLVNTRVEAVYARPFRVALERLCTLVGFSAQPSRRTV